MKTLNTSKSYLAAIYSALKNLPPQEVATIEEMESLIDGILPEMEKELSEFIAVQDRVKVLRRKLLLKKIDPKEAKKESIILSDDINRLDLENEDVMVAIVFEDGHFNTLFDFFSKIGKNVFSSVEHYLKFRKELDEANRQAKEEKETKEKK